MWGLLLNCLFLIKLMNILVKTPRFYPPMSRIFFSQSAVEGKISQEPSAHSQLFAEVRPRVGGPQGRCLTHLHAGQRNLQPALGQSHTRWGRTILSHLDFILCDIKYLSTRDHTKMGVLEEKYLTRLNSSTFHWHREGLGAVVRQRLLGKQK